MAPCHLVQLLSWSRHTIHTPKCDTYDAIIACFPEQAGNFLTKVVELVSDYASRVFLPLKGVVSPLVNFVGCFYRGLGCP